MNEKVPVNLCPNSNTFQDMGVVYTECSRS